MKWVLWTVAVLIGVVGAAALIGWMLPVRHEASSSARFNQPPDRVYAAIADVAEYPTWFEGVNRVDMLDSPTGKVRFREHMKTGPVIMEVEETVPPSRYVARIADPDQPFGGTWTFEFTPDAGGTRVTITERGEIYNPIFRFMARYVFGYTATMEGLLKSLGKKFGESVA